MTHMTSLLPVISFNQPAGIQRSAKRYETLATADKCQGLVNANPWQTKSHN